MIQQTEHSTLSKIEHLLPAEIEARSFEIITEELGDIVLPEDQAPIIKRVIHTTADFDYASQLCFSDQVVKRAKKALREGACIVTDTQMGRAGINKKRLAEYGGEVYCYVADEDVAKMAKDNQTTRAVAAIN